MSLGNIHLQEHSRPEVQTLPEMKRRIIRRWKINAETDTDPEQLRKHCFQPYGTRDGDFAGIDPERVIFHKRKREIFKDACLVKQRIERGEDGKNVLVKIYEETQYVISVRDGTENGGKLKTKTTTLVTYAGQEPVHPTDGYIFVQKSYDDDDGRRTWTITHAAGTGVISANIGTDWWQSDTGTGNPARIIANVTYLTGADVTSLTLDLASVRESLEEFSAIIASQTGKLVDLSCRDENGFRVWTLRFDRAEGVISAYRRATDEPGVFRAGETRAYGDKYPTDAELDAKYKTWTRRNSTGHCIVDGDFDAEIDAEKLRPYRTRSSRRDGSIEEEVRALTKTLGDNAKSPATPADWNKITWPAQSIAGSGETCFPTAQSISVRSDGLTALTVHFLKLPTKLSWGGNIDWVRPGIVSLNNGYIDLSPPSRRNFTGTWHRWFTKNTPDTTHRPWRVTQYASLRYTLVSSEGDLFFESRAYEGYLGTWTATYVNGNHFMGIQCKNASASCSSSPSSPPSGTTTLEVPSPREYACDVSTGEIWWENSRFEASVS